MVLNGLFLIRALYTFFCRLATELLSVRKGNGVDDLTDPVDPVFRQEPAGQEAPRIGVVLCEKQLMVIRIMKQGSQGYDLQIASRFALCNQQGILIHPKGVIKPVAV